MQRALVLALLATACSPAELTVSPEALHWGELDSHQERPDEGYGATDISLRNDGDRPLVVEIRDFDDFHLQLGANLTGEPLQSGQQLVITVGVAAYDIEGGERDTEASALSDPVAVPWSFTPVRNIPVDTGDAR